MKKLSIVSLAVLIFAAGYWIRGLRSSVAPIADRHPVVIERPAPDPRSTSSHAAPDATKDTDRMAAAQNRWSTVSQLKKSGTISAKLVAIDHRGKLSKNMIDFFDMTPAEISTVEQAIRSLVDKANAHNGNAAELKSANDDSVVLTVPPLLPPEDVFEALDQKFEEVLGPERYSAFAALSTDNLLDSVGLFGGSPRSISVTRTSGSQTQAAKYQLLEERNGAMGNPLRSATLFSELENLPAEYRWLARYEKNVSQLQPPNSPETDDKPIKVDALRIIGRPKG